MYCAPSNKAKANNTSIQILTHGIGFDKGYVHSPFCQISFDKKIAVHSHQDGSPANTHRRSYWDLPFDNYNYSYINTAVAAGYHTLSYDRLGLGLSYHAQTPQETRDNIQSFLEVAALAAITRMLRNGTFPDVSTSFTKIIHVGHSFGSAQSYALAAMYPDISDGLVLTGFSMNGSFVGFFASGGNFVQANLNQPLRFGSSANAVALNTFSQTYGLTDLLTGITATPDALDYVDGYLTNANVNSQIYLFLYPGHFDPRIAYYGEQTKQPVTIGEMLTLSSLPMTNSFKGPVAVFTGQYDLPYCGGDCLATGGALASVPASVSENFPDASSFTAYIQPNTGHGLNFHYNATAGYTWIQNWLSKHNLAA